MVASCVLQLTKRMVQQQWTMDLECIWGRLGDETKPTPTPLNERVSLFDTRRPSTIKSVAANTLIKPSVNSAPARTPPNVQGHLFE